MEKSLKIARKKLFWVLLKTINWLFITTLKDFEKRMTIKCWLCKNFTSPTISHINYWDQLNSWKTSWKLWNGLLCIRPPPPTPYFSTNTEAFAKKLPQLLTIKTDNRGSRIGLKFYVSYCIIKKKFGFQVYNKVPN